MTDKTDGYCYLLMLVKSKCCWKRTACLVLPVKLLILSYLHKLFTYR